MTELRIDATKNVVIIAYVAIGLYTLYVINNMFTRHFSIPVKLEKKSVFHDNHVYTDQRKKINDKLRDTVKPVKMKTGTLKNKSNTLLSGNEYIKKFINTPPPSPKEHIKKKRKYKKRK